MTTIARMPNATALPTALWEENLPTDLLANPWADYEMPKLSLLRPNLVGGSFHVMKLLPARFILERAMEDGLLKPGYEVVESTSGTFGLALAMLAPAFGVRVTLVSDPVIDDYLLKRFKDLGVNLVIVEKKPGEGPQVARLNKVKAIMEGRSDVFWPNQYHNPRNCDAYAALGDYLYERLGQFDILVGAVGTGGSICGTARRLRQIMPNLKVVGVDTHHSVVFGQPDGERTLRGLGNSLVPHNVAHHLFDEVHWVSAAEGYEATRLLHRSHGLFRGGTSGAAYMVADWTARQNPGQRVVTLFPDDGYRYQNTLYDDAWLARIPGWTGEIPEAPELLLHPTVVTRRWSYYPWRRRTLAEVMGNGNGDGSLSDSRAA